MATPASSHPCVPEPGLLASIFSATTWPDLPAVALSASEQGIDIPEYALPARSDSFSEIALSSTRADRAPIEITAHVVATPRAFAWFLSSGESGWGRLVGHTSSIAQSLRALSECASIIPLKTKRLIITLQSEALMNAFRADRLPSRRVAGLMRSVRESLSGFLVEVHLADPADPDHLDRMRVLHAAEREGVLSTSLEGSGWMKLSSYDGVEAGASLSSRQAHSKQLGSVGLLYDTDGSIRAVSFDQDGRRNPPLPSFPSVIAAISASAEGEPFALVRAIEQHRGLMTVEDVATVLCISTKTVYRLAQRKQIPSLIIGGSRRFDPAALGRHFRKKSPESAAASRLVKEGAVL